ncbi:MAG TPA: putative baseplate assembly protein [Actinophytocola sp.]|uniref:putative baseplate assembly protein n=1 Tax=Actinophytocola sp. TaxID=1872138 RepID=UPI002DDDA070|nr:putative baseplate assembly protein [Actinophytocola sp.]HEV2777792.1 putative baseplate assembly protein [Actinophytocola sp.]
MSRECCAGVEARTPAPSDNRPGLPALSYRAGTHGRFLEAMLARLSSRRALDGLTTREPDDPAIALLDCWALIGDVLTFYQERIANEGFLRTATERESLEHLGRLVGYAPRPALASSTYLAYTLDPGATSVIPAGSAAKSVPERGELPQTFETAEELQAREEWNALQVRRTEPPDITAANAPVDAQKSLARLDIAGTAANLKAGDRLLFLFGGGDPAVRLVKESTPDFAANRTSVSLVSRGTELDEFERARDTLTAAVTEAREAPVVTGNDLARAIDEARLAPLAAALDAAPNADDVLSGTVADELARLPEAEAIARPRADRPLRDWFDNEIKDVRTAGAELLAVAVRLARRSPTEVEELRALAERLICGPPSSCPQGPPCEDPARATGLVALAPILPALRREPSRPPRNSRTLTATTGERFRADSDVLPKLLTAADPRLAPNLHRAWANQEIAPPAPLAGLQVMRIKARVTAIEPHTDPPVPLTVQLDAVYDAILPHSRVIVEGGAKPEVRLVNKVWQATVKVEVSGVDGEPPAITHTVPVTWLELEGNTLPAPAERYVVWARGEELTPLGDPITDDVGKGEIELARAYDGLRPGRWLVIAGERTDVPYTGGVHAAELAMVAGVRQRVDPGRPGDSVRTTLVLANDLAYTYRRDTVTVSGNVVAATQGETRTEVLGSGDASRPNQSFRLRQVLDQTPLTRTAADNPLGAESSLTVRVNGVAWHETDGLIWAGPTDHSYTLHAAASGVSVEFGDGGHGARPPSGTENITATYRTGAGSSGNVAAGTITQLAARPLGVGAVTNPLPATGGADGDGPGDARAVTPLRTLALDRLVSVRDYEDFTRARAGIGKASAVKLFDGRREVVHVTIAGIGDVPIDPRSDLFGALEAALTGFGEPGVPVTVAVRDRVLLVLSAGIKILADYSWDSVEPAVRAALLAELGFTARALGEPVYLSQVIAAVQRVDGVEYVDVDLLAGIPGDVTPIRLATLLDELAGAPACVPAGPARYEERVHRVEPGDTLTLIAHRYGLSIDELAGLNPRLPGADLSTVEEITVFRGIRPAQLVVLPADVPETLTLRRIP